MSDCGGAHERGDTGEVDYTRFARAGGSGFGGFGVGGFNGWVFG